MKGKISVLLVNKSDAAARVMWDVGSVRAGVARVTFRCQAAP